MQGPPQGDDLPESEFKTEGSIAERWKWWEERESERERERERKCYEERI